VRAGGERERERERGEERRCGDDSAVMDRGPLRSPQVLSGLRIPKQAGKKRSCQSALSLSQSVQGTWSDTMQKHTHTHTEEILGSWGMCQRRVICLCTNLL